MSRVLTEMDVLQLGFIFSRQSHVPIAWPHRNARKGTFVLVYGITRKCEVEVHARQVLEMLFNKGEENYSTLVHQASSILQFIDYLRP